jgi:radical SAM superfamily enzyme YgiQ (UPF0313 family)
MIDNRFNALAHWDNPEGDRYAVELTIISVEMKTSTPSTAGSNRVVFFGRAAPTPVSICAFPNEGLIAVGVISDLGGPTANMFHMRCMSDEANAVCRRVSCLHPVRCKHYGTDQAPYIDLLREVRTLPGIKRVFVNSGLRYDLAALDDNIVEEIATHHVSGTLTTAPEHVSAKALHYMRKPEITHFADFLLRFKAASAVAAASASTPGATPLTAKAASRSRSARSKTRVVRFSPSV